MLLLLAAPLVLLLLAAVWAAEAPAQGVGPSARLVRFDFETGDLQGWRVAEGQFDRLICDREFYHNEPNVRYNKQGRWFLSTLARKDNSPDDGMTGVLESPVFVVAGGRATLQVGGGSHPNTYVALCAEDGRELLKAHGQNTEVMQRIAWDVAALAGTRVFLRMADRNTGGWGHITLDDFEVEGALDEEATRRRFAEAERAADDRLRASLRTDLERVRAAISDLRTRFGARYPGGAGFAARLDALDGAAREADREVLDRLAADLDTLRREALTANPLLRERPIVFVVRPQYRADHHSTETMFQTGEINTGSFTGGGALKVIDFARGGSVRTLVDVPRGIARDPEVSFDGRRILFSMRRDIADDYHLFEVGADGTGLRQLTTGAGLSDIDPMYLPTGEILFSSTREPKVCQCNRHIQANLFRADPDGKNIQQLGRNTLFEGHPALMPDGRILYERWEYVDKHFGPAFGLWTANPDGTNHAVFYGNNAWSPGAILDARMIPGTRRFVATFGSCHDRPWGAIAVVDPAYGLDGSYPVVQCWPEDARRYITNSSDYGSGQGGHPVAGQIDNFVRLPVKYEDAYPLSDRYFLCSRSVGGETMGLFLLDTFGNEVLLHAEGPGCYDPVPLGPRPRPAVVPPRRSLDLEEGRFYVADVYRGDGMDGVPRGTVKALRVIEAPPKLFWSQGDWGIDATQAPAMNWNCTSNKRILGTVPVEPDGSAYFAAPADRFLYFQLLDADGMMVQSMRSGTMAQPGETVGCVGCHESRHTAAPNRGFPAAMRRAPSRLEPWYGAPRDFNYLTEVQPVFDRHCVSCHDFGKPAGQKLNLAGDVGLAFNTSYIELRRRSALRWFADKPGDPKLLVKAVDDGPPEALPAYAWGSHRSRLVDVVRAGHQGVKLGREEMDRIVTWIDMNAPYYGSYATARPAHAFGRSPLAPAQLARLSALVGLPLDKTPTEIAGSQVSFARPEKSPCLERLGGPADPRYAEALAIIQSGREALAQQPREDMPGFVLVGADAARQAKYDARLAEEAHARRALVEAARRRGGKK